MTSSNIKLRKDDKEMKDRIVGKLLKKLEAKQYSLLPTNGEVLRFYLYLTRFELKLAGKKEVAAIVCEKVEVFWKMAGIQTKQQKNSVGIILNLVHLRENLIKNSKKKCYEDQFRDFTHVLSCLFDIAAADAEKQIRKDTSRDIESQNADIDFLLDQQGARKFCLGSIDQRYIKKIRRKENLKTKREEVIQKEKSRTPSQEGECSKAVAISEEEEEETDEEEKTTPARKTKKIKIMQDPTVSLMSDRLNLSSRERTGIVSAVTQALGHDLEDISISKSTASRSGKKIRQQISEHLKETFEPPSYSSIHWDSKLVTEADGKVERLAIVVTGRPSAIEGKLLSVSKVPDSTGRSQANGNHRSYQSLEY